MTKREQEIGHAWAEGYIAGRADERPRWTAIEVDEHEQIEEPAAFPPHARAHAGRRAARGSLGRHLG